MYPINTPGMIGIAAICVRHILWQNEEFIGSHFIFLIVEFIPAVSVYTIKQEVFRQSLFPVSIMVLCLGIVSQRAYVQMLQQEIALNPCLQYRAGDLDTLSTYTIPYILMRAFLVFFHM